MLEFQNLLEGILTEEPKPSFYFSNDESLEETNVSEVNSCIRILKPSKTRRKLTQLTAGNFTRTD